MLNGIITSLFPFWRANITSFCLYLFTWVAYHVMFRLDMICTEVSYCFVCPCISWFIHCFISYVSFIVDVPINHCSASPKEGSRILLGCGLSVGGNLLGTGSVWSSCIAISMVGLYDW